MKPESDDEIAEVLKKVRRIELKTRGLMRDGIAGEYHSAFKGEGIDFEDFREYQHGDEVRSIDWNVTARMGTPFIKNFSEERELTVYLLVDVSPSSWFGSRGISKRELAAEVAALLAFSALQNRDKVGLILFNDDVELCLPAKRGLGRSLRIIREILHTRPEGGVTDPGEALRTLTNLATRRCLAFLISDFQFELRSEAFRSAGAKHDLIAISVSDPMERALPNAGRMRFLDPESGQYLEVDTSNPAVRRAYRQEREAWEEGLAGFLRKHRIDHIPLSTGANYLPEIHGFFEKRERVQLA